MEQPTNIKSEEAAAPFNSAVATLMRLDRILIEIKDLVMNKELTNSGKHYKKYRLIKELFVQSYPLIEPDRRNKIKEMINNFKFKTQTLKKREWSDIIGDYHQPVVRLFSEEKEDELNEIIMELEDALQEKGHFMPSAQDKRGL